MVKKFIVTLKTDQDIYNKETSAEIRHALLDRQPRIVSRGCMEVQVEPVTRSMQEALTK